ncbi:MAG: type II toxin-antitoxin system HicA family toxin [Patescibacteria group bacterium]
MPNGVYNWTFNDAVAVLKENGFKLNHTKGSHFYYTGHYGNVLRQVCVPKHGNIALKPRTLKGIIAQSGLPKEKWGI